MHDTGIVGGMMLNVDSYGEMIGHAVTRFVRGQRIAVEPTAAHVVPMFDWNQIQRWQADIDRLPPNSLFVNRPPTLWGQYKREVISSLIVMLLLGISLIITLAQSRHRRKAELAATKLADSIREMKEASETHLTQQVHARTHDLQAEVRRRAKAEALAQESEFQYRFMADNSLDILWRWNFTQCRFTYASPSVERLCGLATEKFIDLPLEGVFIPDSVETFVKNLRADNRSMWLQSNVLELALLTSNREPLWTETLVSLVKNPTSGETEVIGVSRDITLKRRAKEEQQQFIAMISHEFRTPLAIIRATAERMSEREYSGRLPEQAQFRKIENAVDWLTELMDEFVSDSRMAFDSTGVSRTLIDPVSLLKAASAKMMESASTHGINIHQAVVRSQFLLDPCLIGMALTTLVENAVKHTPPGTQIELSARQSSDGGLYLSVADNGPGIPEDELPLIGNKFFRARNAHSIYGSGLGVYLAKNIARLHGGSLSVTNRPQGGACFQIHLPLDPV